MSWNGFALVKNGTAKKAVDFGILQRDGQANPILPSTRDRTVEIPGRNGIFYFGADLAERRITIPCAFVAASNVQALEVLAAEFAAFLVDGNGKPAEMTLVFEHAPTVLWQVRYSGLAGMTRTVFDGEFDLPLMCPSGVADASRFHDNGDGTITDKTTLLMWSQDANLDGRKNKPDAETYIAAMTLGGHDDWRLPTIWELESLVDDSQSEPALPDGHPFANVLYGNGATDHYWSSTNYTLDYWFGVHFNDGTTDWGSGDTMTWPFLPVRTP